jgi:ribosomal protein S18 acetylase RimI-like enzyme
MREEDVDAVRQVDAEAFGAWWKQLKGEAIELPRRTRANVLACLGRDPEGCFVAEEDGRMVGLIFSRTWGDVRWFGPFAVLPEYQGRGIGQRLIAASLEYLRRDAGRIIGLETMPENPYNLGLYLRQGFQAHLLTFLLTKSLAQDAPGGANLPLWSSADGETQARWLADLREAAGQIQPWLDYSKEVIMTERYGLGETLVLTRHTTAIGLSTLGLVSAREDGSEALTNIHVLALHPAHTDEVTFHALLTATEDLARTHGKRELTVPVNAQHAWALAQLLRWGYRVERSLVRMVLAGTDTGPTIDGCVNLSRWTG